MPLLSLNIIHGALITFFFKIGWNIPQTNYNSYLNLNFTKDTQIQSILEVGVLSCEVLTKMDIGKLT
jgi:hypothetical protein